jgi:hypothetical protein
MDCRVKPGNDESEGGATAASSPKNFAIMMPSARRTA